MSNLLERVQKLIKLAESGEENEARSAALQACKLISKHKLIVTEPAKIPKASPPMSHVDTIGNFIKDVATETASRVTVKDVVNFAIASAKRSR